MLEVSSGAAVSGQAPPGADTTAFIRAIQLESDGKYRDAAPLYRVSIYGANGQNALLGLERVYAVLGWTDSLLGPLDTLLRLYPADQIFPGAQLRSLQSLRRDALIRCAS